MQSHFYALYFSDSHRLEYGVEELELFWKISMSLLEACKQNKPDQGIIKAKLRRNFKI